MSQTLGCIPQLYWFGTDNFVQQLVFLWPRRWPALSVDWAAVIHLHMLPFASTPAEDLHSTPCCENTEALCFQKGKNLQHSSNRKTLCGFALGLLIYYGGNVILLFIQSLFSNTCALYTQTQTFTLKFMFRLLAMIYCKLENFYHMYDIILYWFSFLSKWKAGLVALARVSKINGWWLTLPHHSPLAGIVYFL